MANDHPTHRVTSLAELGAALRSADRAQVEAILAVATPQDVEAIEAALAGSSGESQQRRAEEVLAVWHREALPYQLPPCIRCKSHERWRTKGPCKCKKPDRSWHVWALVAGRGTGKTLAGAHWALEQALAKPGLVGAVVAPTHNDLRRITVEGPSGLVSVLPPDLIVPTPAGRAWNEAASAVNLVNGSVIHTLSAEHPDRIRGENLAWAWLDEMAAWSRLDYAWEQLEFATRIGTPQTLITTTPRPLALLRELMADLGTAVTRASLTDNPHLSETTRARLLKRYAGTRVGRQELEGEVLDETEGALVTLSLIDAGRMAAPKRLDRIVVGVDPSGGRAEIGIVAVGRQNDDLWILEDASLRGSPSNWGAVVVDTLAKWKGDRIAAERNYGGDMVEHVLRTTPGGAHIAMSFPTATRGKLLRAEFLQGMYEQGRVHHVDVMPELEDQLTTYTGGPNEASPDRLDALVWACHELMMGNRGPSREDMLTSPVSMTRAAPSRIT